MIAGCCGQTKVIKLLLSHGAQIKNTVSPLYGACESGHLDCIKILIQAGVDIEAGMNGFTPLYIASKHGQHTIVVKILLNYGADIYILNGKIIRF